MDDLRKFMMLNSLAPSKDRQKLMRNLRVWTKSQWNISTIH